MNIDSASGVNGPGTGYVQVYPAEVNDPGQQLLFQASGGTQSVGTTTIHEPCKWLGMGSVHTECLNAGDNTT